MGGIVMKKFLQVLLTALMVMTFSIASAAQIGNDGFVEVEGVVYPEPGESLNDMRRVAIAEAYRALAEEVDNLHVTSDTTIVKSRRVNDQINISVDAILSGVKIAKVYRESDGSFHAIAQYLRNPKHQELLSFKDLYDPELLADNDKNNDWQLLDELRQQLNNRERTMLDHLLNEDSYSTIAHIEGISQSNARKRMSRLINKLKSLSHK